jgi:hypothetical protein
MALVRDFSVEKRERYSVHDLVDCKVSIFTINGRTFLQLDTYGRKSRQLKDKVSQTLQLDESMAKKLHGLIGKTFKIV